MIPINKTVHAITNRNSFVDDFFVSGPSVYSIQEETFSFTSIKKLLKLDDDSTNYYVFSILSLIESFEYLRERFNDTNKSYEISDFKPQKSFIEFADPVKDEFGNLGFNYDNLEYPLTFTYDLVYETNNSAKLNGRSVKVKQSGNVIFVEWPENFVYTGGLKLQNPWDGATQVRIQFYPKQYPVSKVMEQLNNNFNKESLLQESNLLEEYVLSPNSFEKIAIAATALGLSNPALQS